MCSKGFKIKIPVRHPIRWLFSREQYPGVVVAFKKFEKWHTGYISDVKTTLFLVRNCLMCSIAVMGVKHLVLTRMGDLFTIREGKLIWLCLLVLCLAQTCKFLSTNFFFPARIQ